MSDSPLLGLPYLAASQAQKHVTHNEALSMLDGLVHLAVASRVLATPPGSPTDGARYLIAASPTGDWAGHAGQVALRMEGAWAFFTPREGWRLWVSDEDTLIIFDGASWSGVGGSGGGGASWGAISGTLSAQTDLQGALDGKSAVGHTHTSGSITDFNAATDARVAAGIANARIATITYVIDGGGAAITAGLKGFIEIPFACTINAVTLLADQSGSIVVDIWKDNYANYPPVVGDAITASAKPTISVAVKAQDATLSGWNTAIAAGDILAFNVDSAASIQRLTLSLKVTKT